MLKTLLCEKLEFKSGMKHFEFFIVFLIIITQAPSVGSALINESSNLHYPSNILMDIMVIIISTVIGVIIGVLLTSIIALKQVEKQGRISYISTLLGKHDIAEKLSRLLQQLEMCKTSNQDSQQDLINEVRKTWIFLLFAPAEKRYKELKYHIENKQWVESLDTISKFLRGDW